jgi:uncharacterized protein (UPF0332 family)
MFDPTLFLNMAQELGQTSEEERLRTAIGRAYYAVFLVAREKLGVVTRRRVHQTVIEELKKTPGMRAIGDQLDRLRQLRTEADYDLRSTSNWRTNWITAQSLAERLLPRLR